VYFFKGNKESKRKSTKDCNHIYILVFLKIINKISFKNIKLKYKI